MLAIHSLFIGVSGNVGGEDIMDVLGEDSARLTVERFPVAPASTCCHLKDPERAGAMNPESQATQGNDDTQECDCLGRGRHVTAIHNRASACAWTRLEVRGARGGP